MKAKEATTFTNDLVVHTVDSPASFCSDHSTSPVDRRISLGAIRIDPAALCPTGWTCEGWAKPGTVWVSPASLGVRSGRFRTVGTRDRRWHTRKVKARAATVAT